MSFDQVLDAAREGNIEIVNDYLKRKNVLRIDRYYDLFIISAENNDRALFDLLWKTGNPNVATILELCIPIQEKQNSTWIFDKYIDRLISTQDVLILIVLVNFKSRTSNPHLIKHYLEKYLEYIIYIKERNKTLDNRMILQVNYYFIRYLETAEEYNEEFLDLVNFHISEYLYNRHPDVLQGIRKHIKNREIEDYFIKMYENVPSKKIALLNNELSELEDTFLDIKKTARKDPYTELVLQALMTSMDHLLHKLNEAKMSHFSKYN